ncbi:MAG TPA: MerR family transcriptional regulator [Trueperaceae bacterium]
MSIDLAGLREGAWSLDQVVEHVNRLLPAVLPKDASGRATETVNQRLVRHYATQGLVDEPLKVGREARYLYRHLLQLLVVRRLLAEGFSAAVVGRVMAGRADAELEGLLTGQLNVDLVPAQGSQGDRADFLRQVRMRAGLDAPRSRPAAPPAPRVSPPSPTTAVRAVPHKPADVDLGPFRESVWTRVEIAPGLDLMVREDFRLPTTRLGDEQLMQLLKVTLLYLEQKQRGKP